MYVVCLCYLIGGIFRLIRLPRFNVAERTVLYHFCVKMQKFCILLLKYLVVSFFCCTFAADLKR